MSATEIDIQYNSRYISEGRNNLERGGIVWFGGSTDIVEKLSAGFAYGRSTSDAQDYDELNVVLTYSEKIGEFDWYVGLTRLEFFEDNQHDTEMSGGVSYSGYQHIYVYADAYYSTQVKGTFMEIGVVSPIKFAHNLELIPYILAGFDFGYASEQYDGYNHLAIGTQVDYIYSEDILLYLKAEVIHAGSDIRRNLGDSKNETWLGFGLVSSF